LNLHIAQSLIIFALKTCQLNAAGQGKQVLERGVQTNSWSKSSIILMADNGRMLIYILCKSKTQAFFL